MNIEFPVNISSGTLDFAEIFISKNNRLVVIFINSDNGRGTHVPMKRVLRETVDAPSNIPIDYYILSPLGSPLPEAGRSYEAVVFDPRTRHLVSENVLPNDVAKSLYIKEQYANEKMSGYYAPPKQGIISPPSPHTPDSTIKTSHLGFFAAGFGLAVGAYCVSEMIGLSNRG